MSDRRLAGLLVALAFLMRFQLYLGTAIFGTDGAAMLRMADAFADGRFQEGLRLGYHPLFPILASLLKPLLGSERAGFWVSMILGSAAAAPLFLVARDAVGRPAAFLGALFYAFHPHIVEVQADVMTEGTFLFFLTSATWAGWECTKGPRWSFALLAGIASGAAYLTRPEGILFVVAVPAWLLVLSRRGRWMAFGLAAASALVVMAPYVAWSKTEKNRWTVSPKGSVQQVESGEESHERATRQPIRTMGRHLLKLSYFVLGPLIAVGLFALRRRWAVAFLLSFPAVYWLALAWASRSVPAISYRYLLPGFSLLLPIAGLGMVQASRWLRRPSWIPAMAAAIVVLFAARNLRPHRWEERSFRGAAEWIRAQKEGAVIASTLEKIPYLARGSYQRLPQGSAGEGADFVVCGAPEVGSLRSILGEPRRFGASDEEPVYVWRLQVR